VAEAAREEAPAGIQTAFNELVSLARANKVMRPDPDYVTKSMNACTGLISCAIPLSRRWQRTREGSIVQYDRDGARIRLIAFDTYDWDTNYQVDGRAIGGDNIKGLADIGLASAEAQFTKVTRTRRPARTRLNREISAAVTFELEGLGEDGTYQKRRSYYFKITKRKGKTARISIYQWADVPDDPALDAILESIRES
jgi:hypothetical protein